MIRVLIADDQAVIRQGFRQFLESAHDIVVVGEATSGVEAVTKARMLDASVVIMDVRMPGGDGLTATHKLSGSGVRRPIAVIIVTGFDLDEYVFGALEAGFARRHSLEAPITQDNALTAGLTARELEVVHALAHGLSNAEIGRLLHLVPGTVKSHLTRVSTKIGTRNRVQTAIWAFTHGLMSPVKTPQQLHDSSPLAD